MKQEKNKTQLNLNILWMLLITLISTTTQAIVPQAERDALVALYNSTGGANWLSNSNWLNGDPCDNNWEGINCGINSITSVMLNGRNLSGNIPSELGDLSSLEILRMTANNLTGNIPIEFGNLVNLKILELDQNELIGSIPVVLGNLASLNVLNLSKNQLTGNLPVELGNLSNLLTLQINTNQISGNIPIEFGSLTSLTSMILYSNLFIGSIPSSIGSLSNLIHLDLSDNQLAGTIPMELGNLSSTLFTGLYLNSNLLTGSIPASISNLTGLMVIDFTDNQLTGNIPSGFSNLSNLGAIRLAFNHLNGYLPAGLGSLNNLNTLWLQGNALIGNIPSSFINLTSLGVGNLYLNQNGLYTNNTALDAFLDSKQGGGDWSITQTIAPANLSIINTTASTISLTWDLIEYTQDFGRYHIWYSESPTGSYLDGGATNSKTENSFTLTGLKENTNYYIVVRTESDASGVNQNMIISEDSNQVMATTLQSSQSSIVTGQITDWQESSGTITVGDGINHVTFYWSIASANSGWFYGSSTILNPDSDIAFLDGVTDINQVGDISNILFNGGSIGTFCDIDCDPDGVGDFMIGINVNTGHLAVLRIDNIISRQMNATWWFQKNITNSFDSVFTNNFE